MIQPLVYLVDDDPVVLKSVSRLLQAAGLRTTVYDSPSSFLQEHDPEQPGCAVLDLVMPGMDGLAIQDRLAQDGSRRPVVFLSGLADVPRGVAAMKHGAVDFLTKPVDEGELVAAVERGIELDRRCRRERETCSEIKRKVRTLTPREFEVLTHVVEGRLNKKIAEALCTTEGTIKVHRGRVMKKLGALSLADLVRIADAAGVARIGRDAHSTKV